MFDRYFMIIIIMMVALCIGAHCAVAMISTGIEEDNNISFYIGITFIMIYMFQCWMIAPMVDDIIPFDQ